MGHKRSKDQLRRVRAKRQKLAHKSANDVAKKTKSMIMTQGKQQHIGIIIENPKIEVVDDQSKKLGEFKEVFEKFHRLEERRNDGDSITQGKKKKEVTKTEITADNNLPPSKTEENEENDSDILDEDLEPAKKIGKLSKRQFRLKYGIPLEILKIESKNPELVESTDADSSDPRLLVYIKSQHNMIGIPPHWKSNKSLLKQRRAFEDNGPFELPKFIQDTGILEMRDSSGRDEDTSMKDRMRQRVQPKMSQLDLDFNKLYDAFFKYQTKPELLKYGQIYKDGMDISKLFEIERMSSYRPGKLSKTLKEALGMDIRSNSPPWAQRLKALGPPPSYPHMSVNEEGEIIFDDAEDRGYGDSAQNTDLYCTLEDDMTDDQQTSDSDSSEEEQPDEEEKEKSTYDASNGDVAINSYGHSHKSDSEAMERKNGNTSKPQKLYRVLEEKRSGDHASIYGSDTHKYEY